MVERVSGVEGEVEGVVGVGWEVEKGRKRDQEDRLLWSTGQVSALECWTGHFDILAELKYYNGC